MYAVSLKDGTRLHAYKHRITRRYLHLSDDGRTFVYEAPDFYREVEVRELVDLVMPMVCDFSCRVEWSYPEKDPSSKS
jgi:hypothetical protein